MKSEVKRRCIQDPLEMAEEIDRLSWLCEAKDAEIAQYKHYAGANMNLSDYRTVDEIKSALDEAQAMIAMQAEALKEISEYSGQSTAMLHVIANQSLSATSETVAAWRAKETEPLRREVAMLNSALQDAVDEYKKLPHSLGYTITHGQRWERMLANTQATALAYEREVQARALEEIDDYCSDALQSDLENGVKWLNEEEAKNFHAKYPNIVDALGKAGRMIEELRANKGEVK